MYTSFFGLKEDPFTLSPDPKYLFLSLFHKEALDHLLYGINERKGFIAITGGIGTGKTTLCRTLLSHLDASTNIALIFSAFLSEMELLKSINREFGIKMDKGAETKQDYIDSLNNFLIETFKSGGNTVLLIDEAQNLSQPVLEQIRMLSNLETEKDKLIQVVLVGQSELADMLASPSLRQLDERITVRYNLRPLTRRDIRGYVEHRLVVAGGHGNIKFTNRALRKIHSFSRGNPRRINAICDRALLIAFAKGKQVISTGMIGKAVRDLRGGISQGNEQGRWFNKRIAYVTMAVFILFAVTSFAGWNFRSYISRISSNYSRVGFFISGDNIDELILDDQSSLAALFGMFEDGSNKGGLDTDDISLTLVSFVVEPEYFVMFKKPFRVQVSAYPKGSKALSGYMVVSETSPEGAAVIDKKGNEQTISRDFIFKHWGNKVFFVYPFNRNVTELKSGMKGQEILNIQQILGSIGYLLALTGVYDESTYNAVLKFQGDFGLKDDGIVGSRTRALLYQMVD